MYCTLLVPRVRSDAWRSVIVSEQSGLKLQQWAVILCSSQLLPLHLTSASGHNRGQRRFFSTFMEKQQSNIICHYLKKKINIPNCAEVPENKKIKWNASSLMLFKSTKMLMLMSSEHEQPSEQKDAFKIYVEWVEQNRPWPWLCCDVSWQTVSICWSLLILIPTRHRDTGSIGFQSILSYFSSRSTKME